MGLGVEIFEIVKCSAACEGTTGPHWHAQNGARRSLPMATPSEVALFAGETMGRKIIARVPSSEGRPTP